MWKRFRKWWATEGAVVRLRGLDDRLLADMGLARDELGDRVRGTADADPAAACEAPMGVCDSSRSLT